MSNICFVISNINPFLGGTERVTITLSNGLSKIGYNSYYIFTNGDYQAIEESKKLKINDSKSPINIEKEIRIFLQTNRIKIVIVVNYIFQTSKYQKIFELLKKNMDIKIIFSLHAAPDHWVNKHKFGLVLPKAYFKEYIKKFIFKYYNPRLRNISRSFRLADKYLLLSQSYIKNFEDTYHIVDKNKKLIAIPNPCPFTDIYNHTPKENIVLVVSRMKDDQKRISCILKIWKRIFCLHSNWKLIIVGDGPDLMRYKKISSTIMNISFTGQSSNVQDYYKKSKIFLMTSSWEGMPMTLIEAMHYGCVPIVFDSFSAVHDLIINGQTGYIIRNNDTDAFENKLNNIMKNDMMRTTLMNNILGKHEMFQEKDILQLWNYELKKLLDI